MAAGAVGAGWMTGPLTPPIEIYDIGERTTCTCDDHDDVVSVRFQVLQRHDTTCRRGCQAGRQPEGWCEVVPSRATHAVPAPGR